MCEHHGPLTTCADESLAEEGGTTLMEDLTLAGLPRESVRWFAERMEAKLRIKDPEHPEGWRRTITVQMFTHLLDEVRELHEAIAYYHGEDRIIDECADVANLAMMIADRARYLKETYGR